MLLNSKKLHPIAPGESIDPAGNPSPPDHWDVVPDIVVQAPALFGGHRKPFQMAPFARPHVLWQQDEQWLIDPYGVGSRDDPDFDYKRTTYLAIAGQLVDELEPGCIYLLRHARRMDGQCGVELELLQA